MVDDDLVDKIATELEAIRAAMDRCHVLASRARMSLYSQLAESRIAVTRSRALLDKLDGHKLPRFP